MSFTKLILPILLCSGLFAQQDSATITGTVSDPQGALVPGAKVDVVQVDTGAKFRATTNESGNYIAPGLAVGRYEIRVEQVGFKKFVRSGLTLQVGQNARVDIRLELGQQADTVTVSGEATTVDTGSATLGQVVDNRRLQELPLNGRSALAFTFLTAGVVSNSGPAQSGFGDRGIALSSVSINGGPNALNSQMLDGNNNTLSYVGEVSIPPAVDAVEEFKVQSGPMSAEFGFTAGGAINLVTKSGTNQVRGTLYEFLRNDKMDARNTFAATRLPLRYNQFGGAVGAPILKNRLFGFINYERYLLRRSSPRIATVPIQEWRDGNFSNLRTAQGLLVPIFDPATTIQNPSGAGLVRTLFPGNIVPQSRFDRATPKILAFYPQPNKPAINNFTQQQNYQDGNPSRIDWTQWNWRVDYRVSDRHSVFVRYTQAQHDPFNTSIFTEQIVGDARDDNQTNRNAVATWNYTISGTTLNNLRVGINRQAFTFASQSSGDWSSRLGLPANMVGIAFPQMDFGFGAIGGGALGFRGSMNWDVQDTFTKIISNHTIKLGVNFRTQQGNNQQGTNLGGGYNFGGLTSNPQNPAGTGSAMAQFLLGDVASANAQRVSGASFQGDSWSTFVQDDWKVTRRLTLNLGLRWDWQQRPYERNDGQINFDLTQRDPVSGLAGAIVFAGVGGQARSFLGESYRDFAPRFGWAYDLTGKGKTVFRGGYGIFYPSIFWRPFFGNTQFFSTSSTNYAALSPGGRAFRFQDGLPFEPIGVPGRATAVGALLGQGVTIREEESPTPMTQQWTASLQHEMKGWFFEAAYAGNKGNHFASSSYNINQLSVDQRRALGRSSQDILPNPLAGRVPGGLGAATVTRERTLLPYPQYQGVSVLNPLLGNYTSHQLQLTIRRNFKSGLFVSVAYTGGKKMSDSNLSPTNDFGFEATGESGFQDGFFNRQLNRSIDPNDVSQRMAVTLLYELPFGKGSGFVNRLIGGWQVNSIGIMQTGLPLIVRGANNFISDRPDSTGVSAKLDNPTRARWFNTDAFINPVEFFLGNVGRTLPDVRTPGTINWDLSMLKNTKIKERFTLQFRAEAFNFLNKVNWGSPAGGFSPGPDGKNISATFGGIFSARDARVAQMGLKLLF
jgi:hypothetical protein